MGKDPRVLQATAGLSTHERRRATFPRRSRLAFLTANGTAEREEYELFD